MIFEIFILKSMRKSNSSEKVRVCEEIDRIASIGSRACNNDNLCLIVE